MSEPGNNAGDHGRISPRWVGFALVLALLAAAGAIWTFTQWGASEMSAQSPGSVQSPDSVGPSASPTESATQTAGPSASPTTTPDPGSSSPPPETTGPATAAAVPQPGDPAPVDRSNKSDEELATIDQPVAPPVPLVATKVVKSGVSATISELVAVEGEAIGIGEIAGPAIRFKVTVQNDTGAEISLDPAVINVSYGQDDSPASTLSGPGTVPFPASVAPGTSASGVFVFGVPKDARNLVKIYLNLDAATPIAAFEGQAPA